jgi:inorganic triphosphatase YgiF
VTRPPVEAELKYAAADERPLRELETAGTLGPAALGPSRTVAELDRYLDTPDLRLAGARWACRLRIREGRILASLKGPAEHRPGDVLHLRPELEGPAGPGLDPSAWPPSAARDLLTELTGGGQLVERFSLDQRRTERVVAVHGVRVGLLSLDRCRVLHGEPELGRLMVVELEFRSEAVARSPDVAQLAAALAAWPGLDADPLSKLERALALVAAATPRAGAAG